MTDQRSADQIITDIFGLPPSKQECALITRGALLEGRILGYGEHPNRKCISGSDGSLIPARSRDHTGLWLLSVAKLIAKVRTFAADFYSKESPAEPMTGKPLQNLRVLRRLC